VVEKKWAAGVMAAISQKSAVAGIIGMGYVGLPLAAAVAHAGFKVVGFDIDEAKLPLLNNGQSYIEAVGSDTLKVLIGKGLFGATNDFSRLRECDVIVICVPTPLTRHREPDMSYIENTGRTIGAHLRPGQLVILESTSYPGTTREVLKPLLERSGFTSGEEFFLGFSPEREDPGNTGFGTSTIPKLGGGDGADALTLMTKFYGSIVNEFVPVASMEIAEAAKITENVFRAVNIALVNELKIIYAKLGIDIWEVIEAAKTKPFGYMPFYPGPGLGGHCIPIDPFYLTWKSREYELPTRFIELAGEVNVTMPHYVVETMARALDTRHGLALTKSSILILGMAYKKNISDIRESPSLRLMELLEERGAKVAFHDPFVAEIPSTRAHGQFARRRSVALDAAAIAAHDCVLIATDHDAVDYTMLAGAKLVVDTRNAMARHGIAGDNIVKA